jgi:hypothetical protein
MSPINVNPGAGGARVHGISKSDAAGPSRNQNPAQSTPAPLATVIPFPKPNRFVWVTPAESGGWLVTWRGCGWLHGSIDAALADAHAIAAAHGVGLLEP